MLISLYECGKCKLVSKEHKNHMIENNMLNTVIFLKTNKQQHGQQHGQHVQAQKN